MIGDLVVRWRYMREGDMLEYHDRNGNIKQIGPVKKIDWRADRNEHQSPAKKYVLVPALRQPEKLVSVPLEHVQAVFRGGVEIIRFQEGEEQHVGCAVCGQRHIDGTIAGRQFCSLACQMEWIETYYGDYPPGQNPIDLGVHIHSANCGECRKANRVYCPRCVD